jgi:small subunit ribosomal protein S1
MAEALEQTERIPLSDLEPKMKFEGEVKAVELYGAFVDIGAERDGLVHISQISEETVNRVADVLQEGDEVTVWVRQVDPEQGRIALTMVEPPERTIKELEPEQVLMGTVTKLVPYGAFVDIGVEREGLIHISEMSDGFVGKPSDVMEVGDEVEVRVVKVNQKRRRIELSLLHTGDEQEVAVLDEEDEGESLTALGMALQNAMEQQGMSIEVPTRRKGRRRRKSDIRREQASIIARTLNNKQD